MEEEKLLIFPSMHFSSCMHGKSINNEQIKSFVFSNVALKTFFQQNKEEKIGKLNKQKRGKAGKTISGRVESRTAKNKHISHQFRGKTHIALKRTKSICPPLSLSVMVLISLAVSPLNVVHITEKRGWRPQDTNKDWFEGFFWGVGERSSVFVAAISSPLSF